MEVVPVAFLQPNQAPVVAPISRARAETARAGQAASFSSSSSATLGWSLGIGAAVAALQARRHRHKAKRSNAVAVAATQGDEIKFAPAESSSAKETEEPAMSLKERATAIAQSMPAIANLVGRVVVIKYGGAAMVQSPERTIRDVALLRTLGLKPVLVHGGGPAINTWLTKVGIKPNFVRGLRVTDAPTMEVAGMVLMGKVNKGIVATMGAAGVKAVGLSGVDGRLLQAKRVDDEALGFVGDVTGVDVEVVKATLDQGMVPVVATVAADESGTLLNVNADIAAAAIAGALDAEEFVLMTDVAGILRDVKDPGSLISTLDPAGARALIDNSIVAGGMIPKVTCCLRALEAGVQSTHIIDGRRAHSLIEELLASDAGDKLGTSITKSMA